MNINRVTITGADDEVSKSELRALSIRYPFVEWGILFSYTKQGSPRYPSYAGIHSFPEEGMKLSAHFCGGFSREVLEQQKFTQIDQLPKSFARIQINYTFRRGNYNLKYFWKYASNSDRNFILQYNKANKEAIEDFLQLGSLPNIHLLYDSSGGRGREIDKIHPPLPVYTGYSGGISLENINQTCCAIRLHKGDESVWIDLESGARTDNRFDLEKVEKILGTASNYISQP